MCRQQQEQAGDMRHWLQSWIVGGGRSAEPVAASCRLQPAPSAWANEMGKWALRNNRFDFSPLHCIGPSKLRASTGPQ